MGELNISCRAKFTCSIVTTLAPDCSATSADLRQIARALRASPDADAAYRVYSHIKKVVARNMQGNAIRKW